MNECILVIPCYNEASRLDRESFSRFLNSNPGISLLFVNDGSRDSTGEILRELCADNSNAAMLDLEKNRGKAEAVRLGMLTAAGMCGDTPAMIGFWDADGATPLGEVLLFLEVEKRRGRMLLISGCRLRRLGCAVERSFLRHLMGRIFAAVVGGILRLPVYDTQCGAKLYDAAEVVDLFKEPFATKWFFDVEILCRMSALHGRENMLRSCYELPLTAWSEVGGSKLKFFAAAHDFVKLLILMMFHRKTGKNR